MKPDRTHEHHDGGERWGTRLGVILAVAGSAVGIGNFLRFPGRAALYGGGAFLIPYFVSLLLLGIPLCWVEWTLGRYAGARGRHSAPSIYRCVADGPLVTVFGALAVFVPLAIFTYYVLIESWCLAYAFDYLLGGVAHTTNASATEHASRFTMYAGAYENGALLTSSRKAAGFLLLCIVLNFAFIARGLSRGVETVCKYAMPLLLVAALVVLVRVLTFGTVEIDGVERHVVDGLGFMWNPHPAPGGQSTTAALVDPQVWLEAAGQVFFTLSVGFGIITTLASYVGHDEDVALSALAAVSTNELCEVCLGGLITIPAAFLFLGPEPLAGLADSSITLGFHALPAAFARMPWGQALGFLWFGLLFLAALTSSLSMLQPGLAFFEENFGLSRGRALGLLVATAAPGCALVAFLTKDLAALSVADFWVGSAAMVVLALFEVILFGWVFGARRGIMEANRAGDIRIPTIFVPIVRYVAPAFLVIVLAAFLGADMPQHVRGLLENRDSVIMAAFLTAWMVLMIVITFSATTAHRLTAGSDISLRPLETK